MRTNSDFSNLGVLDDPSELTQEIGVGWRISCYRGAGEASITRRSGDPQAAERQTQPDTGAARAMRNKRRYALHNRLDRFVTLTYRKAEHSRSVVLRHLKRVFERVRRAIGKPVAWLRVIGLHSQGNGLHVHMMAGQGVAELVDDVWGYGHVDVGVLQRSEDIRKTAQYLGHEFDAVPTGRHRYEVAQGFTPEREVVTFASRASAQEWLRSVFGREPLVVWPLGCDGQFGEVCWWESLDCEEDRG